MPHTTKNKKPLENVVISYDKRTKEFSIECDNLESITITDGISKQGNILKTHDVKKLANFLSQNEVLFELNNQKKDPSFRELKQEISGLSDTNNRQKAIEAYNTFIAEVFDAGQETIVNTNPSIDNLKSFKNSEKVQKAVETCNNTLNECFNQKDEPIENRYNYETPCHKSGKPSHESGFISVASGAILGVCLALVIGGPIGWTALAAGLSGAALYYGGRSIKNHLVKMFLGNPDVINDDAPAINKHMVGELAEEVRETINPVA